METESTEPTKQNPSEPGWYHTVKGRNNYVSHFDGNMWGVGWHDVYAARGKETLAHYTPYKGWSHKVDV